MTESVKEALDRVVEHLLAKTRAPGASLGEWTKMSVEDGEVTITAISPGEICLPAPTLEEEMTEAEKPEESRLAARLASAAAEGCWGMRVRWMPGADALTREQRAAEVNRWLDADARGEFEVIDSIDAAPPYKPSQE